MIQINIFYFNDLRVCCYLLWDETKEAIVVDPGCHTKSEQERFKKFVQQEKLDIKYVVNTHAHFDHAMGNAFVCTTWGVKSYLHPADLLILQNAQTYCQMFGIEIDQPPVDILSLSEKEELTFGRSSLTVIETPGHSPGGVCLYSPHDRFLITGDTLFAGNIGRTDLPGGDYDQLIESITQKIIPLASPLRILPGHGNETTLAEELCRNPYILR
ncbi:MAG: MBL fold metallo-hydrolase [Prevotellaceae bacterium]|jgi:glyoxylase-like metal-dependent hydrolase (beta-lactamase superfamily II)|nr:MBL fold metallo-hydrolase [Prevotellaceae bacterium]